MPELDWRETAVTDLMWIVDWISGDSPAAALAQMVEIESKIAQLPVHPKRCRLGKVDGTRELIVLPNCIVIQAEIPETVTVLRVLHAA